jgi:hypothetical protein
MNKKIRLLLVSLLVLAPSFLVAQVQINGTLDVAFTAGGEDSKFISNGINQEFSNPHISIPQVNLLMFAPINESFFVEARLQSDTWGTGQLSMPRFTLANLTWANPDNNYALSFGRFITPVGKYSSRSLNIDRTFVDLPLNYSYFINISDERGFWPAAGDQGNYTSGDVGLTNIYFGGYSTGALWDWSIKEDKLRLQTAVTMAAPASDQNYTNLNNLALQSHLTFNPNIFWELGLSASYGGFMQRSPRNSALQAQNPFEEYKQALVGLDVRYSFAFVEIIAEGVFSRWNVPCYTGGQFNFYGDELAEYRATNAGVNVDLKYEPPFLPGSYAALRVEHLNFLTAETDSASVSSWDDDVSRVSAVFGYKLARNVTAKVSISDQSPLDQSLYAIRFYLSAFF